MSNAAVPSISCSGYFFTVSFHVTTHVVQLQVQPCFVIPFTIVICFNVLFILEHYVMQFLLLTIRNCHTQIDWRWLIVAVCLC